MKLIGLVRLGRDAETRFTQNGDAVCSFSGAFNYGRKGDGQQPSQWVEFALWGSRGEKLAEHLLKGTQLFIVASDVHVETYEKRDGGTGVKLVARVDDLQFSGGRQEGSEERQQRSAPAPQRQAPQGGARKPPAGHSDFDESIPF
jgi:single-strand DNA-binding protein